MTGETMNMERFEEMLKSFGLDESLTRRYLLRSAAVGAAVGAAGIALPKGLIPSSSSSRMFVGKIEEAVLNFALNLEYLEAEFYTYATTGRGIEQAGLRTDGKGDQGATTGGRKMEFSSDLVRKTMFELAHDERQHVNLLREVLGPAAIAKPEINLNGMGMGFGSETEFLTLARAFEDTGVSAYGGAAPLLGDKAILGAAAQILSAEAYHAGNIRLIIALRNISVPETDKKDVPPPPSGQKFFCVDSKALSIARLPPEVLSIVKPFFPSGLNGTIK